MASQWFYQAGLVRGVRVPFVNSRVFLMTLAMTPRRPQGFRYRRKGVFLMSEISIKRNYQYHGLPMVRCRPCRNRGDRCWDCAGLCLVPIRRQLDRPANDRA